MEYIWSPVQNPYGEIFVIDDIRKRLLQRFRDLNSISNSTISRWLRNTQGMSFKKLSKVNAKLHNPGQALKVGRWKCCIHYLLDEDFEVVYVDEFSYFERKHLQMGWALKGKKRLYPESKENFTMNFIVALSARRYYPVLGLKRSWQSQIFLNYIEHLLNYIKKIGENIQILLIVCDNATIHKSQHMKERVYDLGLRVLTTLPYCPWLNSAEQYIGAVKKKMEKFKRLGRYLLISLKLFLYRFISVSHIKKHLMNYVKPNHRHSAVVLFSKQ